MLLSEPLLFLCERHMYVSPKGGEGPAEPAVEDEEEGGRGQVGHDVWRARRGHQEERGQRERRFERCSTMMADVTFILFQHSIIVVKLIH